MHRIEFLHGSVLAPREREAGVRAGRWKVEMLAVFGSFDSNESNIAGSGCRSPKARTCAFCISQDGNIYEIL
jgi:hypothetical protein